MGWRKVLAQTLADAQNDNGDGTRSDVYYPPNPRAAAWVETALRAMPAPDRIALARELLAGTGRVVARDVPGSVICDPWWMGWDACRQAMLPKDDTP